MTEQVSILSNIYDTYASVDQADIYLNANFLATAWFDLTIDQKGQLLVTATRLFDRQCWLGTKTDISTPQPLQWPRTDTGIDGVIDTEVPDDIVNGSIEMAFAILDGNEAINQVVPGAQKIREQRAGSVSLSFFRNAEGDLRFDRFPLPVQELVQKYTCGGTGVSGLSISGVDGQTVTDEDFGFNEGV